MRKRLVVIAMVLLAAVAIVNVFVVFTSRNEIPVSNLVTGDCLAEFYTDPTQRVVEPVVCSVDHVQEVVGVFPKAFDETVADYPSDSSLQAELFNLCVPAFNEYTSLDYETAEFQIIGVYPDEQAWESEQRALICLAERSDKTLIEGTLAAFST